MGGSPPVSVRCKVQGSIAFALQFYRYLTLHVGGVLPEGASKDLFIHGCKVRLHDNHPYINGGSHRPPPHHFDGISGTGAHNPGRRGPEDPGPAAPGRGAKAQGPGPRGLRLIEDATHKS